MTPSNAMANLANPLLGRVLADRYEVRRLIGRGGMGLVYVARDRKANGRDVVIKMLAPHWADDPDAVARFRREGARLAQLRHPNIVEFYAVEVEEGQRMLVMEYIRGEPLDLFIKRRPQLSIQEFFPVAKQILDAVAYAHEQAIMLRDIKPANIMLCERDGTFVGVKLLDFGLAKLVDGDEFEVTKAHVVGTAGYLAPELIKGEKGDARVDIYALGIMFDLLLTGESPIVGEHDGALLYNHVHGHPKPLLQRLPMGVSVPSKLVELLADCLAKDPNRRPTHGAELRERLVACCPKDIDLDERPPLELTPSSDNQTLGNELTQPKLRELLEEARAAQKLAERFEDLDEQETLALSADASHSKPSDIGQVVVVHDFDSEVTRIPDARDPAIRTLTLDPQDVEVVDDAEAKSLARDDESEDTKPILEHEDLPPSAVFVPQLASVLGGVQPVTDPVLHPSEPEPPLPAPAPAPAGETVLADPSPSQSGPIDLVAPPPTNRLGLGVGLGLLGTIAVVTAIAVMRTQEPDTAAQEPDTANVATTPPPHVAIDEEAEALKVSKPSVEVIEPQETQKVGRLLVQAPQGATILIDDEERSTSAFEGDIAVGEHSVVVRSENYEDWTTSVTVTTATAVHVVVAPSQRRAKTRRPRRKPKSTASKTPKTTAVVSTPRPFHPDEPLLPPKRPPPPAPDPTSKPGSNEPDFLPVNEGPSH